MGAGSLLLPSEKITHCQCVSTEHALLGAKEGSRFFGEDILVSRRLAREVALRVLYQVEVGRTDVEEALRYNADELGLPAPYRDFAAELCKGTLAHLEHLDSVVEAHSVDWRIERMPYVDRNILRMAVYELLYRPEIPVSVTVNEAVELAKTYGDVNSGRFVNGILGNLARAGRLSTTQPGGEGQRDH